MDSPEVQGGSAETTIRFTLEIFIASIYCCLRGIQEAVLALEVRRRRASFYGVVVLGLAKYIDRQSIEHNFLLSLSHIVLSVVV